MSLFTLISLIVSIFCAMLAIFTFLKARNQSHLVLGIFNVNVTLWCLGLYLVGIAQSPSQAIFYWKVTLIPNTFISVFFYHLVYSFCQLNEKRLLILIYIQGILFTLLVLFYKPFLTEVSLIFNTIYFAKATPLISLWLSIFSLITGIAFYRIWQFVNRTTGEKKIEALYLFWGMLVGFGGGFTIALPLYSVPIYPAWHFLICIYTGIFTFSILRHHFLDIRVGLIRLLIPACIFTAILFVFCLTYFDMNLFSVASLSEATLSALLAFIVFAYSTKKVHRIWAIFNVIITIWGLTNFGAGMSATPDKALIFWRLTCLVCTFISVVYYHVIIEFCQIKRPRMLSFAYIQGALFVPLIIFSDYFIRSTFYAFDSFYYYKATFLFAVWTLLWFIITGSAFFELYRFIKRSHGIQKTQALYVFWATLLGHTGGAITILPAYNVPIYPAWHFSVCIYAAISTYAIFKYQLMDIRIAVTRIGIFVLVYSLVLGLPFGLTFWGRNILVNFIGHDWYWIPIILSTIFATTGPYIYFYFQRKAENQLLSEERRINALLTQASYGMTTIHDLTKLLKIIVNVLSKTLRVDHVTIYLLDQTIDRYVLMAPESSNSAVSIDSERSLIPELKKRNFPLVYEEIKMRSEMENHNQQLTNILDQMDKISCNVIIPIIIDKRLLGFITLSDRKTKETYSKDLLNALAVLGNQTALAVENCHHWERETKRLEEESFLERVQSLDMMAASFAHEIDNPMTVILGQIDLAKEFLNMEGNTLEPNSRSMVDDCFKQVKDATLRVSGMIKAIEEYSKKGRGTSLKPVRFNDVVDDFLKLIGPQIKKEKIKITKEIQENLPFVLGDKVQLEEILMNFSMNSFHALRPRQEKLVKLKAYQKNGNLIRVEFSDNGYGIPPKLIKDIFLASVTTKGSSEGSGLGLYRVRKIVDVHKGDVWAESEGPDKGALFVVELPIYKGDIHDTMDETRGKKLRD